jgi:two-component system chemotaxis response regulator CheB
LDNETKAACPNLVVAIGASAGGLPEIRTILELLPESFQGVIIVVNHRDPQRKSTLVDILGHYSRLKVVAPSDEDDLECTTIYVGAPNQLVQIEGDAFEVETDWLGKFRRTKIDELFQSVAESAGANAVGVVLSGMLWDGVAGLKAIRENGGYCIVQDPKDASFKSMPENALKEVVADFVGTSEEIANRLVEIASGRSCVS